MRMEEGVRKRVVTLHSQQAEGRDDIKDEPPPENLEKPREEGKEFAQVRAVAKDMFACMCNGAERDVITEENLESAIQNLSDVSMNPTKSLVRMMNYAALSEGIKSTIRKLLKDCLHDSNTNKEVGTKISLNTSSGSTHAHNLYTFCLEYY